MVMLCDGCGDDISRLSRPECHIPLSGNGGIDLCPSCRQALGENSDYEGRR
ncbi:hypothetical protein JCM30237_12140 [Halolamina litorea]|uniref:Small CPxCG-related zinc finger protein n=1 Tax=Halolamina litorea TaxID=1515593 RepID=A0ABD6BLI6_9EURY|nr:hypothetical protein [Halolamina litorea]